MTRAGGGAAALLVVLSLGGAPPVAAQAPVRGDVVWRGRPATDVVLEWIPDAAGPPPAADHTVSVDQRSLRFRPNVLAVHAGTVVRFHNSDDILHNVFSPERRGHHFDLGTYGEGETRLHRFDEPGSFIVLCHVHPEMALWVVAGAGPFLAVTDEDGRFRIDGVPPGPGRLVTWHRRRVAREDALPAPPAHPLSLDLGRR